jgi:CheY-like chemotaxis protein/HPt (histidine-containing phosphotransfer) domain-containing protein
VEDGEKAIEEYKRSISRAEPFPLVLLDLNMPRMDGYQVAAKLRALAPAEQTAIIILASSLPQHSKGSLDHLKVGRKLSKPIRRAELREAIASLLDSSVARFESRPAPAEETARKLRLLLVEDNHVNQKLAVRLLEKMGHEVALAVNGKEAVDFTAAQEFDLVLMDMQMPVMGGMEATRQIREREKSGTRRIPIVAMTAHAMKGDEEKCLAAGMDGYVSKPVRVEFLRSEIQRVAKRKGADNTMSNLRDAKANDGKSRAVNLDELLARVENDWDLLREIGEIFREDFPKYEAKLIDAAAGKDLAGATEAAHALKGMLANLSAAGAAAAASQLEQAARDGREADLAGALEKFKLETEGLLGELDGYLAGAPK